MTRVLETNLATNHTRNLRFRYKGNALPGVLMVRDGSGRWWEFQCKGRGGDYTISGTQWENFAASKINSTITLFREDGENNFRIEVRP